MALAIDDVACLPESRPASENGETILRRVLPAVEELIAPVEYAEGVDGL